MGRRSPSRLVALLAAAGLFSMGMSGADASASPRHVLPGERSVLSAAEVTRLSAADATQRSIIIFRNQLSGLPARGATASARIAAASAAQAGVLTELRQVHASHVTSFHILFDPLGRVAAYSQLGTNGSGFGHVEVHNPLAGTWTAVIFTVGTAPAFGPVQFGYVTQKFHPAGTVSPAARKLAPGQSATFRLTVTAGQAGDQALKLHLGTGSAPDGSMPVVLRAGPRHPPPQPWLHAGRTFDGSERRAAGRANDS